MCANKSDGEIKNYERKRQHPGISAQEKLHATFDNRWHYCLGGVGVYLFRFKCWDRRICL